MTGNRLRILGLITLVLLVFSKSGGIVDSGPRLISVVYESADMPAPLQALAARELLAGEQYRIIDDDVTTGAGQVPREVAATITAARENGLPALVVATGTSYDRIALVMDLPTTPEEIVRAVK